MGNLIYIQTEAQMYNVVDVSREKNALFFSTIEVPNRKQLLNVYKTEKRAKEVQAEIKATKKGNIYVMPLI